MITCCEGLIVSLIVNVLQQAIYAGYYIKITFKSAELSRRTKELEKKNGAEQHQIDDLKAELQALKSSIKPTSSPNSPPPPPPVKPQPQPPSSPNPTDLVAELKQKQQAGKIKPSDFKNK